MIQQARQAAEGKSNAGPCLRRGFVWSGFPARLRNSWFRLVRKAEAGEQIELQSITMLAQLYSTPDAPLTARELLAAPLTADGGESAQAIQTEAIVCRWFEEIWNQRRLDVIEELAASDCVLRAEGVEFRGHAAIRRRGEAIQAAFSDVEFVVEQMLSAADMVMSRWRMAATHSGPWMGAPASGERVIMYGASWIRLEGGLLREGWDYWQPRRNWA
ncbi:MAG TPA: ester cyclase [Pirellulales bacterium]|nr:ester cyclase [Pirellulales bacterium]